MTSLVVLGSTGSIGRQTLDLVRLHADAYTVHNWFARSSIETIFAQCQEFEPKFACLVDLWRRSL